MKKEEVKKFFEQTDIYFNYDYNIKIRTETVADFIKNLEFNNVLDMPCGNGYISISNSKNFEKLTLVDFSENMIKLAKEIATEQATKNVSFLRSDIYDTNFQPETFDLVISLGILAHVDDVEKFLAYIQSLVQPKGHIIIQNTDYDHNYSRLIRFYLGVRRLAGKDKYQLNKVPAKLVENSFKKAGFTCNNKFRYNQSFVGLSKLFSNEKKYELTRRWFGNVANNKNAKLGSDYIYHFIKK